MATLPADQQRAEAPPVGGKRKRDIKVALWPIVIVFYATIMPREIRFAFGTFEFFADRIGMLIALPYIIRKLMEGAIRFVLPDFLVMASGMWMMAAMTYHYGLAEGLERGGSLAFDSTVGYYLARISFRSLDDMRKVLILFAPGAFIAGLTVMIESIARRDIVQPIAEALFGKLPFYVGGDIQGFRESHVYIRLGLARAKGPFSHSIHAGLFLASLIGIYNLAGLRGWPKLFGNLAGALSFFSLSSAALLGMLTSYGLIIFEHLQRRFRELSWKLLLIVSAAAIVIINLATNSGFIGLIIRYLTFNRETAFYRLMIWDYGSQSVASHPVFGIGFTSFKRVEWMVSESIDAHWLLLAVRFGLFPAVAFLLAVVLALIALGQASVKAAPRDRSFYRGIAISLFVMSLSMFTVTLWGGVQNWFTLLLGGCVACSQRSYRPII